MVYQETLFIGMRLIAVERLKIRSYFDLKEYNIKNGPSFADDFYGKVSLLFGNMTIHRDPNTVKGIAEEYHDLDPYGKYGDGPGLSWL